MTVYNLDSVVSGQALGEFIEALIADDQAARLAELEG
jgi:peptide chain release factor 1